MLQQHSERAYDRGHCRLQGIDANEPWQFLDTLGTARAWAQYVTVQMHSTMLSHTWMTAKQRKC